MLRPLLHPVTLRLTYRPFEPLAIRNGVPRRRARSGHYRLRHTDLLARIVELRRKGLLHRAIQRHPGSEASAIKVQVAASPIHDDRGCRVEDFRHNKLLFVVVRW